MPPQHLSVAPDNVSSRGVSRRYEGGPRACPWGHPTGPAGLAPPRYHRERLFERAQKSGPAPRGPPPPRRTRGSVVADQLVIRGAREHNLKDVSLELPRDSLIVFTGLSGSGKSSLAFDTISAEARRRNVEPLAASPRQFLGQMDKPDVDFIEGL